jgi:hypothetical protein
MLFLVTNKHLIREPSPLGDVGEGPFFEKLFLRINTKLPNTDGKQYQMVEIPVVDDTGSLVPFISSQEGNVDLALTPIRPDANKLDFRTIPDSLFATSKLLNDKGVNENDEVLFTGLFAWNPGAKKNYPIVRHGKVARLFEEPIPWDKRYPDKLVDVHLADVMSFGGNSGSPVFLRIGGVRDAGVAPFVSTGYSYYLLGVMQGYFPGDIASQNSGIAAIIPADKILHILDSPRARAYRERFVAGTNVQRGNLEAAAESYRKAITILEESAPQHSDLAGTLQGYARLLRRLNRIHEADAVDERAKLLRRGTTRDRMNPRF